MTPKSTRQTERATVETLNVRIVGTAPLLMHSDKFANPLHPATKAHKALTGKRKKTDDDHEAIAKSEFLGGCYHDATAGFFVPGQNFDASFLAGAKLQKLGTNWKRGVLVMPGMLSTATFCAPLSSACESSRSESRSSGRPASTALVYETDSPTAPSATWMAWTSA